MPEGTLHRRLTHDEGTNRRLTHDEGTNRRLTHDEGANRRLTHDEGANRRLRTMDDVQLDGKRVLVRVDFNVAVGDNGRVDDTEDYRLEAALPTIQELQQRRCRIMLLTHMGEPRAGKGNFDVAPVRDRLQEMVGEEVRLARHLYGNDVNTIVGSMEPGSIMMLPNVRLDEREEIPNEKFAQELANVAEVYVNEGFSVCHRAHTSVTLVPRLLPACAGRRTVLEVEELQRLSTNPDRPYVGITSGAKISTKIGILRSLLKQVDRLCLGGQIANLFLAAAGTYANGQFLPDEIAAAKSILDSSRDKLVLPVDVVVGAADGSVFRTIMSQDITADTEGIWDIGEQSVRQILDVCKDAQTIMWNGPVGRFEIPAYAASTSALVEGLAQLPSYRVVGGGDTVVALEMAHKISKFNHVSVGGGAMIAFLEGKNMPGLEPLYSA